MEKLSEDEAHRRQAIRFAIACTLDTPLEPDWYERELLARYGQGQLTLDQVQAQLADQLHYVLYYSRAELHGPEPHLPRLLEATRRYNEQHAITGLLCYSAGSFVQFLEGPGEAVQTLYATIRRVAAPYQVVCLRDGAGPTRQFAHLPMASAPLAPLAFEWLITRLEARGSAANTAPVIYLEPPVCTLLAAFGQP